MMHYAVIYWGGWSFFEDYHEARDFAREFNGVLYNLWGLRQ